MLSWFLIESPAHAGDKNNEMADLLAKSAAHRVTNPEKSNQKLWKNYSHWENATPNHSWNIQVFCRARTNQIWQKWWENGTTAKKKNKKRNEFQT